MSDPYSNELVSGKETIVRRRGAAWSFHLPLEHTVRVVGELVFLSTPQAGSVFKFAGTQESDDEVVVRLGGALGHHRHGGVGGRDPGASGYPLPEIQEEFERLQVRWKVAGLPEAHFTGWPVGSIGEEQLAEIRRRLREVE